MLVIRESGLPAIRLSVGLVVSDSGPVIFRSSGAPCGHRGKVICCEVANVAVARRTVAISMYLRTEEMVLHRAGCTWELLQGKRRLCHRRQKEKSSCVVSRMATSRRSSFVFP